MKIIALINQKGGVGKTTSAISIASYLSTKHKVLLIDMDPQGNATSNCQIDKTKLKETIGTLLLNDSVSAADCILKTNKGFDIIPSNLDVAAVEFNLYTKMGREYILKEKLSKLDYEFVILDCSPSLSVMSINALIASNLALTPIQPQVFAIEGISSLTTTIGLVKKLNPHLQHKYFIAMFDGRLSNFIDNENKLRLALTDVLTTKIRIDNTVRKSQDESKTLYEIKMSKASEDYIKLVKEVLEWLD